jgi:tetratricopeptide (TPR) repeat protein
MRMVKTIKQFCAPLILLFLLVCTVIAAPQDQYLQIYLLIQEGEKLENAGQASDASGRYQNALDKLQQLSKENPEWEPTIVNYRIKYCKDKVSSLSKTKPAITSFDEVAKSSSSDKGEKVATTATTSSTPSITTEATDSLSASPMIETAVAPSSDSSPVVVTTSDSSDQLKSRIRDLEGELSDTKQKLGMALAESNQLKEQVSQLEVQLSNFRKEGADDQVKSLMEENSKLKKQLADTQNQVAKLQSGDSTGSISSLQKELENVQKQLNVSLADNQKLTSRNKDLESKMTQLQATLDASQTQLADSGKASPLARENEMLRDIVNRQLKEQARREAAKRLAMDELKELKVDSASLKTQLDILGSPLIELTPQELSLLKAPKMENVVVDNEGNISAEIGKGNYAERPRIPTEFTATANAAAEAFSKRNYEEAASQYQRIVNAYPESLFALSNLAVVRFQQQKYDEAEKLLYKAIKTAPQDAFVHSILGIVLYQKGSYDEAIKYLTRAAALDPQDAKTHNYLGIASSQKGWQEAAERECKKAVELDPNYGDAHFNLAVVYATQNPPRLETSRTHYSKALELGVPRDPELERIIGTKKKK